MVTLRVATSPKTRELLLLVVAGQDICSRPADIVFLLDDSRSIWIKNFRQELKFVQTLVSKFDVSPSTTRIAAVTFSTGVKEEFSLEQYSSAAEVSEAVGKISQRNGGTTDTHSGIRYARETVFKSARTGVPRILVIITDGVSTKRANTLAEATETINSGIAIIVIGIGRMDQAQLAEIASKPTDDFLFSVESFPELTQIESFVAQQACQAQSDQPKPEEECKSKPADVVFVLDESNSVYVLNFYKQLQFVNDVVDIFDIGPSKTQVAIVKFSTNASVEFYLNEFDNKQDIQDRTAKIVYTGGNTATGLALALVRDDVLTAKNGARDDVPHIVVVITDGQSQETRQTRAVAETIKDSGVHMFAIGVGPDIDKQELRDIGSEPSEKYVFEVDGYSALDTIKEIIAYSACTQTP